MTLALQTFANGDTNYVAKHNANYGDIQSAVNGILTALGASSGASTGNLLQALFGTTTAFLGNTSYTQSTAGTVLTLSSGYAWRPDLGNVLFKGTATALDFAGQSAATYYILLGADGTPARSTSSTFALYSVVWSGSAFGAITAVAPILPNGDVTGTYQTLTLVAGAVTLAKMANLAANSVIGNNTGSPATPVALALGGANGVASLDSGGKVPTSQLPAAVLGGVDYQGTWNANTNSPSITTGTASSANKGFYYKVSTAGSTTVDGNTDWHVGDWIVSDGSVWEKIDNYEAVTGVAGLTGAITAAALTAALNLFSSTLQGLVPASGGGTSTFLCADGTFKTPGSGGAGGGSVTSVGLSMPAEFSVSGSPVTGSGTLTATKANQSANQVFAGPSSGAAAAPAFRALVAADVPAVRYDIATFYPGVPGSSQTLLRWIAPRAVTIPSGGTNSQCSCGTAATANTTLTIKQNGSSVGTILVSAAGTSGAFTVSSVVNLVAGDVLTITGPATADATLADIAVTLAATA
jgi:hypothetical protein